MRTIAVAVAILCACFMQEVSGELLSATPEIKEEAVTHLTEKKVEKSAEEVEADAKEAAEEAKEAAENKEYEAKAAEFEKLSAKAEKLDIEAEKYAGFDTTIKSTTKAAADEAHKEYVDAVQMFAKAEEVKADEQEAADKAEEAAENKELEAKEAELEKLDANAKKLELEAEKDGASNTTKTAADEARKEFVDAVKKHVGAEDNDEDNEADEEDMDNEEDEEEEDNEAGEAEEEDSTRYRCPNSRFPCPGRCEVMHGRCQRELNGCDAETPNRAHCPLTTCLSKCGCGKGAGSDAMTCHQRCIAGKPSKAETDLMDCVVKNTHWMQEVIVENRLLGQVSRSGHRGYVTPAQKDGTAAPAGLKELKEYTAALKDGTAAPAGGTAALPAL